MSETGISVIPSSSTTAPIEGGIHDDATEPRQRRRVTAESMTRTKRSKKRILHHVFRILADVACGNSAQLPPGLFVQVYYRIFQGTLRRVRL
jgi:hypothetical protein